MSLLKDTFFQMVEHASTDKFFGLPQWIKETDFEQLKSGVFIIFSNEKNEGFTSAVVNNIIDRKNILGIVTDENQEFVFDGLPVLSMADFYSAQKANKSLIAIISSRYDVYNKIYANSISKVTNRILNFEQTVRCFKPTHLDYRVSDWRQAILDNISRISELEKQLCDDYSKETLFGVLLSHLTTNPEYRRHIEKPYETLYFRSGLFSLCDEEVFLDGGASIGESITSLLYITERHLKRAWLVEPDKFNIETLKKVHQTFSRHDCYKRIEIVPKALGSQKGTIGFAHMGGHVSRTVDASEVKATDLVSVDTIDNIVAEPPTFIKMDIEGSEMAALYGAKNTIQSYKPKLAISAYHRDTDLLDIFDFVKNLRDDYQVGLRHHTPDRWDTCLDFF